MKNEDCGAGATLLMVEDDPRIRAALGMALVDQGYRVVEADSGERALLRLREAAPDLVLLDLMLPGIDGLDVCTKIRAQGDLPIIMVTARADTTDVIAGLEAGADDYVTKPVDAVELSLRIRALLRRVRPAGRMSTELAAGDVVVRPAEGTVVCSGVEVALTKTEFRLLCVLLEAAGDVVTREQLLEQVWGYDYFGDTRLLDVHIRRLRRKIETQPSRPRLILTVRGTGYRVGR